MFKNYMTVAFRALADNRAFALINILGLAIGMAACILLLLFVRYETTYDSWLPGHETAYQVQTVHHEPRAGRANAQQMSAYVVGRTLAKDFPEIKQVAYVSQGKPVILQDGVATTAEVLMAETNLLDILQLPLVRGDRRTAFRDMNSLLLTETEAAKRFGSADPIGKTLSMVRNGQTVDYRVTGILKDIPRNSHLKLAYLVPFNPELMGWQPEFYKAYGWNSGYNYVQLKPGKSFADIAPRLPAWEKRNIAPSDVGGTMVSEGDDTDWILTPVADIHLGPAKDSGMTPTNDAKSIATFALIALLILTMACINFTNLSTARAGHRAREVALRKVMGASRRQLVVQFLGESLVVAALAMVVALALVELVLPWLSDFLGADLALRYLGEGGVLLPVLGLTLLVGLAAGVYPALALSGFDPAPVLKSNRSGSDTAGGGMARLFGAGGLRSALVVLQFAVSIALTICTAVVTAQTFYARSADAGYSRDGLLQVTGIGRKQIQPVADNMVDAIARIDGVKGVGRSSIAVGTDSRINTLVRVDGNPQPVQMGSYNIDTGFFAAMGIRPLAGRGFDRANPHDDAQFAEGDLAAQEALARRGVNIVVNVSGAKQLGFANPADAVGKTIRTGMVEEQFGMVPTTIVGVVPDIQLRSFREPIEPIMFVYDRSYLSDMVVRVDAARAGAVQGKVVAVWKAYAPQVPFEAQFAEAIVAQQYESDEARAKTFAGFAALAIFVACLGLYGLAAFTAERRTREIGIRKVLGARNRDIVRLLVWQFSRPVLIANLIAWPVAWWLMRDWLDGFAQRISLGPQWFIGAGLLAAGIAAATIISHALRVAGRSPALALRYE